MQVARQVVRLNFTPTTNSSAAIRSFLAYGESKRLSPKTLDYYGYRLGAFQRFIEAEAPDATPQTITRELCQAFIMTRRYAEIADRDALDRHRQFSADRLQPVETTGRRRRLR